MLQSNEPNIFAREMFFGISFVGGYGPEEEKGRACDWRACKCVGLNRTERPGKEKASRKYPKRLVLFGDRGLQKPLKLLILDQHGRRIEKKRGTGGDRLLAPEQLDVDIRMFRLQLQNEIEQTGDR